MGLQASRRCRQRGEGMRLGTMRGPRVWRGKEGIAEGNRKGEFGAPPRVAQFPNRFSPGLAGHRDWGLVI